MASPSARDRNGTSSGRPATSGADGGARNAAGRGAAPVGSCVPAPASWPGLPPPVPVEQPERLTSALPGAAPAFPGLLLAQQPTHVTPLGRCGGAGERRVQMPAGLIRDAEPEVELTQRALRPEAIRLEVDRPLELLEGELHLTRAHVGDRQHDARAHVAPVERYRLLEETDALPHPPTLELALGPGERGPGVAHEHDRDRRHDSHRFTPPGYAPRARR